MKKIGIDVGGSHVTVSVIENNTDGKLPQTIMRKEINAKENPSAIISVIGNCIKEVLSDGILVDAVGIAFPGPFNYEKGVSEIKGVGGKFEPTFGVNIQQGLKNFTGLNTVPFVFANDAHCFAEGAYFRHQLKSNRTTFLTLGTGFGSAFMIDGDLVEKHLDIPENGVFYNKPFLGTIADECFSTRWILAEYKRLSGETIESVKAIAGLNTDISNAVFEKFGANMGTFLFPWFEKFGCEELVIGGNISKAKALFLPALKEKLNSLKIKLNIVFCDDAEQSILRGATIIADKKNKIQMEKEIQSKRKTTQPLLPVNAVVKTNAEYNVFPSFHTNSEIFVGFKSLANAIVKQKTVVIDGFGGVLWENFKNHLNSALTEKKVNVLWYDIDSCLKSSEEIDVMIKPNLNGDDPVFGKRYLGELSDFFDVEKLNLLQPDTTADVCIVYGTGASLANWEGKLIYVDVPKNEIQYRMRACSTKNIGCTDTLVYTQIYKRMYFIEWPVLNAHKERLLPKIDLIVDEQRIDEITWMQGSDFRSALNLMLEGPLRARPWFEAGVWGGHWMKNHIADLNQDEVNYAWSFELITPENGIVFEGNNHLLEVSFDFLMFKDNKKVLGKAADRFGNDFPIRFDYLDTFDGGNLSVQCHPRPEYIKENFGESFTQDETYYILDCADDADVYLGFTDDINPEEFKNALIESQEKAEPIEIEKYVQKYRAKKHELYLIPNGTIHASGKNNMVLEISSTPYIFTFKMYDWVRPGLDGKPRPINVEHGFKNVYFDRKGERVANEFISKQNVAKEFSNGRKMNLPTHEEHFYAVDRYEFTGKIEIETHGQCHICMLVEGDIAEVSVGENSQTFKYAETFVIPANVPKYKINYKGDKKAFVVVSYVKDSWC
ncbi:ROK family protein [Flavobacterium granuli]|uniref:NBD/HSP70 family sugar kinase/mannose-6-phosphate isomerase class I n=1 Tax=Flavobacterium granuli TaxID=280093 RepID=A0ABU1S0V7_9FLAO|nr:ROK family protein [Flavobacterium granuli]MDR6844667.1 putative NBD/HSP70 family sugar kinase/mannose-6-phosphate isomerase class I [Flavobacterium granuli]